MRVLLVVVALMSCSLPAVAQNWQKSIGGCASDATSDAVSAAATDAAIQSCTALIQSGRQTPAALAVIYGYRGLSYWRKHLDDQAMADFAQAIALDPNAAEPYVSRSFINLARGLYDQVIADCEKALILNTDHVTPVAFALRGAAYYGKGLDDLTLLDAGRALSLARDYPYAYLVRGAAYQRKGLHDKALADFNQAIRLDTKYSDAYLARAASYDAKGLREEAIADYRAALKLNADLVEAQDALKRLGATL